MPPDDPLGRRGPKLTQFLSKTPQTPSSQLCPYARKCTYGNKCKLVLQPDFFNFSSHILIMRKLRRTKLPHRNQEEDYSSFWRLDIFIQKDQTVFILASQKGYWKVNRGNKLSSSLFQQVRRTYKIGLSGSVTVLFLFFGHIFRAVYGSRKRLPTKKSSRICLPD